MNSALRLLPLIGLLCSSTFAQTTITLQPGSEGKDAFIDSRLSANNYGDHPDLAGAAWTNSGQATVSRSLIEFDLSSLPPGATIVSAYLTLYAYNSPANGSHSTASGPNNCLIQRITESWSEQTATWQNQPAVTTVGQLAIPSANTITDVTDLNVTAMIQEMIVSGNHGMMLRLDDENYYRRQVFASSDNANPALHPKLVITYEESEDIICNTLQLSEDGKDAFIDSRQDGTNFGSHIEISAIAWTNSGTPTDVRSLFEFDLSGIPASAMLASAELTLYAFNSPVNGSHSTLSGPNTSYVRRVLEPWNENTVTWSNQPATTSSDQRTIASSSVMTNVSGLDVTPLVQTMLTNGNYGFMLQLADENYYRSMIYASGDNPDSGLHPRLEVCYYATADVPVKENDPAFFLFPNPSDGVFHLERAGSAGECVFSVWSAAGQRIYQLTSAEEVVTIDLSGTESGVYFIRITGAGGTEVKQLVLR